MLPPRAWMPNGPQPFGIRLSRNAFAGVTSLNEPSKTSTRPLWKSVAYSRSFRIARPLKTARVDERSAPGIAVVAATVGDQPRIVPASVAQRKRAAAVLPTANALALPLKTVPVG